MPVIDPGSELPGSAARLFRVQKAWFYHDSDHCIGLRLFHPFGNSTSLEEPQGIILVSLLSPATTLSAKYGWSMKGAG